MNFYKNNIYLKITQGPHKGEVYNLTDQTEITIGRDAHCHISLNKDKRVSRQHVQIYINEKNELIIKNTSERNKLKRNNKDINAARLKHKDIIVLGHTVFTIFIESPQTQKSSSSRKKKKSSGGFGLNPIRLIIIIVAIGGIYLGLSPKKDKNQIDTDREPTSISSEKGEERTLPEVPKVKYSLESRAAFVQGFRDFKKGQYESSLAHFQNCLALDPSHTLCTRYISLARKKIEELIQYNMITGRKYLDQKQYQACSSTFENAMILIGDPSSNLYREAKENNKFCESMKKESF